MRQFNKSYATPTTTTMLSDDTVCWAWVKGSSAMGGETGERGAGKREAGRKREAGTERVLLCQIEKLLQLVAAENETFHFFSVPPPPPRCHLRHASSAWHIDKQQGRQGVASYTELLPQRCVTSVLSYFCCQQLSCVRRVEAREEMHLQTDLQLDLQLHFINYKHSIAHK